VSTGRTLSVRRKKLLIRVAVTVVIVALIFGCQIAFRLFGPNTSIKAKNGTEIYKTSLAGVEYRIPVEYFKYVIGRPRRYATEILISAALPDMRPLYSGSPVAISAEKGDSKDVVIILMDDAHATTSLQFRFDVEKKTFSPLQFEKSTHGLFKYVSTKGNAGFPIEDSTPVYSNGKQALDPSPEQKKGRLSEFYIDKESDDPSVYIVCHGDTAERAPGCTEHFVDRDLLFQVSFNKIHMSEWAAIRSSATTLMHRMAYVDSKQ
jgi:hypothetical protein